MAKVKAISRFVRSVYLNQMLCELYLFYDFCSEKVSTHFLYGWFLVYIYTATNSIVWFVCYFLSSLLVNKKGLLLEACDRRRFFRFRADEANHFRTKDKYIACSTSDGGDVSWSTALFIVEITLYFKRNIEMYSWTRS